MFTIFFRKHLLFFLLFLILIFITLFCNYLLNRQVQDALISTGTKSAANNTIIPINTALTIKIDSTAKVDEIQEEILPVVKEEQKNAEQIKNISVTFSLPDEKIEIEAPEGSSVYDLMQILQKKGDLDFKSTAYSGLGNFVEEINGIKNDSHAGKYWIYYINGKSATVGVSNYILNNLDNIEWKYEKANF